MGLPFRLTDSRVASSGAMPGGYHGVYVLVDLTKKTVERVQLEEQELRSVVGGAGLAVYLLLRHTTPGVDPFAPENPIVIAFSPLVGSPFTTTAKFCIASKSPLTERCCDALCSSAFALAGKRAGVDALVIRGASTTPSVLVVDPDGARLEPAEDIWGLTASEADFRLRARYAGYEWVLIGPAGENLVRFATVQHDGRHAGRGGLGAVMGSKRLKAVVVGGTLSTRIAYPEDAGRLARELARRSLGPATAKYRMLGTMANVAFLHRIGALPARNCRTVSIPGIEFLSAEALTGARKERKSCAACTIGCEHRFETDKGGVRLEYESVYALGAACGISDPAVVFEAARLCDEYGLDTISTGVTVGFALECAERGWLQTPPLLNFAPATLLELIARIARRDGDLGKQLAEGVRRLAERLGGDALRIAPHVKGLELPGYDPRAMQVMGLGYAVAARGADHNRTSGYEVDLTAGVDRTSPNEDAVRALVEQENRAAVLDSLILCKFVRRALDDFYDECAQMLRAVTGWELGANDVRSLGERVVTLRRLFNVREGAQSSEDTLPERFFVEPLTEGPVAGAVVDRERFLKLRDHYYRLRGWNEAGKPLEATLRRLGIDVLLDGEARASSVCNSPKNSPVGEGS